MAQSHRRQIFCDVGARPPTALTWFGEAVAITICADEFWRGVGEWVALEQAKNSPFAFEKSLYEREDPLVQFRRRHGGEPHLPVEFPMIGRHDARRSVHVPGFSLELVFAPMC